MRDSLIFIFLLTSFLFCLSANAQEINFPDIVPEEGERARSFEDYLVQVAWMNNQTKLLYGSRKAKIDEEVKLAKKQWLRGWQFNASLSPRDTTALFNLPEGVPPNTVIPPFLNFGMGISLGDIFTQRNAVKIKKKEAETFDFEINIEKLRVRKEVLQRYQKYLSSLEILKARKQAEEDASTNYVLISEKFRKDKASFEENNEASISYHNAVEKRLNGESEVQLSIISLEEMLGVRWEQVARAKPRYEKKTRTKN